MISINKEIDETIINCFKSKSDIASMLPKIIFFISTEVGFREIMNNPNAKKDVKIIPIIASSLSFVCLFKKSIVKAASDPEINAPIEKGRPKMYAPATPGTTECDNASPISDHPFNIRYDDKKPHNAPTIVLIRIAFAM